MPNYDFRCTSCEMTFERKLPYEKLEEPTKDPCPECFKPNTIEYVPNFSGLGDPIKLGITRPPDAFLHGVLGRMQNSVPDGTKVGKDGIRRVKHVDFSNKRYSPGRLV